jgi:hypothetical protein
MAPDVGKRAYELFVEEAITENSELWDVILILGDFYRSRQESKRHIYMVYLPKVKWKVKWLDVIQCNIRPRECFHR